jgi:PIN like domain
MASSPNRSKKQSVGSSARPPSPPEDFVLYLDENLHNCKPILHILAHTGVRHERHGKHFAAGTEDAVWLPFVEEKGWILLTKDKRIRFNDLEKHAVIANRVREFYFTSGNFNGEEMAALLVVALPEMIRVYSRALPNNRFC